MVWLSIASLVACDRYFACTVDIASRIALYACFFHIASLVAYDRCLLAPWIMRVPLVIARCCTMDIARPSGCHPPAPMRDGFVHSPLSLWVAIAVCLHHGYCGSLWLLHHEHCAFLWLSHPRAPARWVCVFPLLLGLLLLFAQCKLASYNRIPSRR